MKRLIALFALLVWAMSAPAIAQTFPKLTGRVVDQADLLDPAQEEALTAKLAALETQSQRQFVVATISDLEGYDDSDYGYRLGRAWGIGDKERNDGLLLLVAPNDRKVRIEVGYGLEGIVPDALSHRIIQDKIIPRFKANDYPGGINAGVDSIITQLQLPPDEAANIAAQAQTNRNQDEGFPIGAIIFLLFILFFVVIPIIRSLNGGGKKHRRRGYDGPVIIWGGGDWGGGSSGGGSSWGGGGFGGFSGGGGSFGGGGASGGW